MYVPSILDRVRIEGDGRVFIVVRMDEANGCADLLTWGGDYSLRERVPFSMIFLLLDAASVIWPAG